MQMGDGPSDATSSRRWLIVAGAFLVSLLCWWLLWPGRRQSATLPGEAPALSADSKETQTLSPVHARSPADPPELAWPRLKSGLALLEKNDHATAAVEFERQLASGALSGDEAGMALYFQADALFALGKLPEAGALYEKFVRQYAAMPAADNARSALEYIANAPEHRKALEARTKP